MWETLEAGKRFLRLYTQVKDDVDMDQTNVEPEKVRKVAISF